MKPNNSEEVLAVCKEAGTTVLLWIMLKVPSPLSWTEQARMLVPPRSMARNVPVSLPVGTSVTRHSKSDLHCVTGIKHPLKVDDNWVACTVGGNAGHVMAVFLQAKFHETLKFLEAFDQFLRGAAIRKLFGNFICLRNGRHFGQVI